MISPELAKKIRYIQIRTNRSVNETLAGEYLSVFKGQGMEFEEVREYLPGDDVRTIDWNVTARTGKPFVKRFVEERELTVVLVVDLSASGRFGTVEKTKNETAAELCALVSFAAIKNNDRVGLLLFTDAVELYIPPAKGTTHVLRIIRELLSFSPRGSGTDITAALDYLGRIVHKRAVVFLVSDFHATGFEARMRVTARRHDLIAVSVTDPRELEMVPAGLIQLEDAETGERILIDTSNAALRQAFAGRSRERARELRRLCDSMEAGLIEIETGRDYLKPVIRFFKSRERT